MPVRAPVASRRLGPDERRRQIARVAAEVFARSDPGTVTLRDAADAAGVSRALVYKYFGDRAHLLAAAYVHDLGRLDDRIRRATEVCSDDRHRLRALVETYVDFAATDLDSSRLLAALGTLRHPAVRVAMDERIERVALQFGDAPFAAVVARGIVGMLESSANYRADHPGAPAAEVADILFRLLWAGLNEIAADLGLEPVPS